MAGSVKSISTIALLAMVASQAEAFVDPTQPPASVLTPVSPTPATTEKLALQSVLTREGRPSIAIINGKLIGMGERVGEARLVSLSENRAVLEGPGGELVLDLTPGVDKKPTHAVEASRTSRKR